MAEEAEKEMTSASIDDSMTEPDTAVSVEVERHDGPVTLRLLDAALWHAFHQEGTEMIITKAGRRMFPFIMVTMEGLSPTLLYSVHLSLVPCDHHQYKFCQRRWVNVSDTAPGPTPSPEQFYVHPASPNRGSFWCQEMISFAKLKITNNKHSQGDIVLQSMRKYMAQITVHEDLGDTEYVFPLPETTFVAVTQYQNEAVTRMKIAHNPFANGFKYAHVTGSEDGKKLFSRSEMSRSQGSKHKYIFSGSKSGGKTARMKATVTPQPVAPVILNPHVQKDAKIVSQALALTTAVSSLHHMSTALCMKVDTDPRSCLSLTQESEVLPMGFHAPTTATISPYVFQSDTNESLNDDINGIHDLSTRVGKYSPNSDRCSEADSCCPSVGDCTNGKDSDAPEEKDCDESTTPMPSVLIPTTVTDKEENVSDDTTLQSTNHEDNDVHEQQLTVSSNSGAPGADAVWTSSPGVATNLSKKGELFKQPLPRKNAVCGRKNGKKSSSVAEGSASGTDVDMHWYRSALRQANQRAGDSSVKTDRGVQLKLHDAHIWQSFAACGSKMLVSAEGRTMFPLISISLRGLDPGRLYSVWLHVTPVDADVTYPAQVRDHALCDPLFPGSIRRQAATDQSVKPYMHPCSPMRGLAWMKIKVTFGEVKLATVTSGLASVVENSLTLQYGRRYLTQVVVREEEEVTPNGAGSFGNLYFFSLPEVTFVTKQESDDAKLSLPVTTSAPSVNEPPKRSRDNANTFFEEDLEDSDDTTLPPPKVTRVDMGQWMRPPAILPRPADMATLLPRSSDLSAVLPRPADLCNRINSVYCFPPVSTLPPAHVGLLANRMPLPVASPLQSVAPFPFHPQLFPQLRTPMHSAFSMALPPYNPYPYFYYPYSLPPVSLPSSAVSEGCKGLDLSLKSSEAR